MAYFSVMPSILQVLAPFRELSLVLHRCVIAYFHYYCRRPRERGWRTTHQFLSTSTLKSPALLPFTFHGQKKLHGMSTFRDWESKILQFA